MARENKHWVDFYNQLVILYDSLLDEESGYAGVMYQSKKNHLLGENSLNKRYRAVLYVGEAHTLEEDIKRVKSLFYKAVEIDNQELKIKTEPKLPVYIPYFLDDENDLFKIQIHENKAHSSVNYKQDKMIPIASCPRGSLAQNNEKDHTRSNRQVIQDTANLLEAEGYTVEIEDNEKNPYVMLSVDVATLCDKYECDSIQRRYFTGRQIRANFFTKKDGIIQKSKLATIGTLLLRKHISVVNSFQRSTRTDAKYTKQHVDEIILDIVGEDLRSGRLYKRYNEKNL